MAEEKKKIGIKKARLSEAAYNHMIEYQSNYEKETYRQYSLRLNKKTNADIIEHLARKSNVRAYLIGLILEDMGRTTPDQE